MDLIPGCGARPQLPANADRPREAEVTAIHVGHLAEFPPPGFCTLPGPSGDSGSEPEGGSVSLSAKHPKIRRGAEENATGPPGCSGPG